MLVRMHRVDQGSFLPCRGGFTEGRSALPVHQPVKIIGFVGRDPKQRQARNNGSKFTVLSVATQRSWKNAEEEWVSKVERHRIAIIWNPTGAPLISA